MLHQILVMRDTCDYIPVLVSSSFCKDTPANGTSIAAVYTDSLGWICKEVKPNTIEGE